MPRGRNCHLLLALVLDHTAGWADNCSASGRILGTHRDTVRGWRDELQQLGLVAVVDGLLVATAAGRELLRQSDPLPRALLRGRGRRPSAAQLRASAVVYSDAVGWRSGRHGCRSDAERATVAGVGRAAVVAARAMLARRGLVVVEELQRGRADLRRARLTEDRHATHGSPIATKRIDAMAKAAARGRRGAERANRVGAEKSHTPMQEPTVPVPMQGRAPARQIGSAIAPLRDGCSAPAAAARGLAGLDLVRHLLDTTPQELADRHEHATLAATAADAELRRLAADPNTLPRLLAMPTRDAIAQVLAAAAVFDTSPRRRAGLAAQAARVLGLVQVLTIALDVVLGRPRNPGAVLLVRIRRALAGGEVLTRSRANWPIGRFLAAAAAEAAPTRATPAPYSPHAEDRAAADERALLDFATAGSWRMVAFAMGRPVARERGWSPAWLAARSGLALAVVEHGLATAAAARATA